MNDAALRSEADKFAPVFCASDHPPHQPGLHALLVGISRYPYLPMPGETPTDFQRQHGLGLSQLTCAATSAFRLYQWLMEHTDDLPQPLMTCRLLLAATDDELARDEAMAEVAADSDATLMSVLRAAKAWRAEAAADSSNSTLFYFAGHGFERTRGAQVLVMEDVGDGIGSRLSHAIEAPNLMSGMAPAEPYPLIARQQVYIFDACRLPVRDGYLWENEQCSQVWSAPAVSADERAFVVYHTTRSGTAAFAIRDEQTAFSKALLVGLGGAAAREVSGRWCVTANSLQEALPHLLATIAKQDQVERQHFEFRIGGSGQITLSYLDDPPNVDLNITVTPDDVLGDLELTINDLKTAPRVFGPPLQPHPLETQVTAGQYLVTTRVNVSTRNKLERAEPPRTMWELDAGDST